MSTLDTHNVHEPLHPTGDPTSEETSMEVMAGGSFGEAIAGIATIVLAIIGLAGGLPVYMAAIATIVIGVGLVLEGGSLASRFTNALGTSDTRVELGNGMSAEVLGGFAGIVLGILSLVGLVPGILTAVSAIVFGAVLGLSCRTVSRLNIAVINSMAGLRENSRAVARELVNGAVGVQALIGLAGIILGILAVVSVARLDLTLVALLVLGVAVVLTGSALGSRMLSMFNTRR
jgi:hypothetical protein